MKKLILLLLITVASYGQQDTIYKKKWTLEGLVGMAKGIGPYTPGYASSEGEKYFGRIAPSNYELNLRYNISSNFATRFGFGYQEFQNSKRSPIFNSNQYSFKVELLYDIMSLFKTDLEKVKVHLHSGVKVDYFEGKQFSKPVDELNGGIVFGVMPEFILFRDFSLLLDVTIQKNVRQHLAWDGFPAPDASNLYGEMISSSIGIAYQFGKPVDMTTDEKKKAEEQSRLSSVSNKLDQLETKMNDTDKDGVADYLDEENNSVAGVAVDSRGRMVDLNRNGVPDEIEKQMEQKVTTIQTQERLEVSEKLIKEGYIYAKFKKANSKPEENATSALDFVRTHLKNNPTSKIKIIGYADALEDTSKNKDLALKRAIYIENVLLKAGIAKEQLEVQTVFDVPSLWNENNASYNNGRVLFRL